MGKATTRLFIGSPPCCSTQAYFDELIRRCRARIEQQQRNQIHWTHPHDRHLTLGFLGETPDYLIPSIEQGLVQIAGTVSRASGHLFSLSPFPAQNAHLLAAELTGDPNLQKLHQLCQQLIIHLGMTPGRRSYRPHITLARGREGFCGLVPVHLDYSMPLNTIALYKSIPAPDSSHYQRLFETALCGIPL
ncbi:RNA 2',3'-cyclic phosphodiesterase [Microbulbifer sp. 2205BS26-8]|uniref:RNA 2',3'-cyclic phosphodiesterase n=1 Tax=Microbulbifer sp. 2205BS26-8 TaxID=3064386 RepID=UPI00273DAF90|nr:RNA 2',3'-cyclic phosphodiesterase [Microbulbifer sp. 2205BS26-8]MDP5209968.1 RNA 2',3'-cyclic phosphodiesterase [Microbulbifer sp. 2205BS26-8]